MLFLRGMAKRKSKHVSIKNVLIKLILLAIVVGGVYVYQNPMLLPTQIQEVLIVNELIAPDVVVSSSKVKDETSTILGKTTSLLEEGLQNIKVPKNIIGGEEEIVLQEVFDNFTQRVKNLPNEQVDRIKIQFCKDLLEPIPNVSVEIKQ